MQGPQRLELLGFGSFGIVYKVTQIVAVKRLKRDDENNLPTNEHQVFDLLERYPTCPNIVQSFYRVPSAIFLHLMSGGTIDQRLRERQTRDPVHNLVIEVNYRQPQELIQQWIAEITDAITWLESLELVHGDLRPPNLLLDSGDHVKVSDFDSTTSVGKIFEGIQPPWARVLGDEGAEQRGTFGYHGPRTEQFAIGSVIYTITRGFEPYEDQWLGEDNGGKIVELLQEKIFPSTDDSDMDCIIRKCWEGKYSSIRQLHSEVLQIYPTVRSNMAEPTDEAERHAAKRMCMQLVEEGILDQAPEYPFTSQRSRISRGERG
ncbi:MAG: hypothetical protein Q9207_005917 [Kuettlingeria erythrocarpa]